MSGRVVAGGRRGLVSDARAMLQRVHAGLGRLRETLDEHVVGQAEAKEAIMLALVAKEHVYIEGPPGVAKTYLSEIVAQSTNQRHWFYQMHRDTRLNELVGESVIVRDTKDQRERIRQDVLRGGILTADIAVLDDISRAPGEALNVLLRILNERSFAGGLVEDGEGDERSARIPLRTAIATGNPADQDEYYAEPLDPATLDRFTLQVRASGLINSSDFEAAAKVIDLFAGPRSLDAKSHVHKAPPGLLHDANLLVPMVVLGDPTKRVLLSLLNVLRTQHNLSEENSILTDRTFLVKAVNVLKANAILNGRHVCEPRDLYSMKNLTTFRVPQTVHAQIKSIIDKVLRDDESSQPDQNQEGTSGDHN